MRFHLHKERERTCPGGAPFFCFSTSTLFTVLLAVLTSESALLASESEQLEVGKRKPAVQNWQNSGTEKEKNVELRAGGSSSGLQSFIFDG